LNAAQIQQGLDAASHQQEIITRVNLQSEIIARAERTVSNTQSTTEVQQQANAGLTVTNKNSIQSR
jgi:hypothetical protein